MLQGWASSCLLPWPQGQAVAGRDSQGCCRGTTRSFKKPQQRMRMDSLVAGEGVMWRVVIQVWQCSPQSRGSTGVGGEVTMSPPSPTPGSRSAGAPELCPSDGGQWWSAARGAAPPSPGCSGPAKAGGGFGNLAQPVPFTPQPELGGTGPHLGFIATQHVPGAVLLLCLAVHADGIREGWSLHFGVLRDPWGGNRGTSKNWE